MVMAAPAVAAITWFAGMAVLALVRPIGDEGRRRVWRVVALGAVLVFGVSRWPEHGPGAAWGALLPALYVLAAYWTSGAFYVAPDEALERRLLDIDRRAFRALGLPPPEHPRPRWLAAVVEAAYLAVHPLLVLGAWTAWRTAGTAGVDYFWTVVFVAEATSYTALVWIQTRPPRALESSATAPAPGGLRRLNEAVLRHAGNQVNTLPSGHAAGAVAVALALASLAGAPALPFGLAALAVVVATVLGRYHFVVDTVAGTAVAVAAWACVTVLMRTAA